MSMRLDSAIEQTGTRFRIFPQPRYLTGFDQTETIRVSVPPDTIQLGPADDRMYVVDAINKIPYQYPYLPPHYGASNPPVQPNPETGHFDHLDDNSREFKAAQMYATVRRTLDIWEDYFGQTITWHFALPYPRMELIPLINWDNAHSGYGFLEFGYGRTPFGAIDLNAPYCMNFDVLAHEFGHSLIFATIDLPGSQGDKNQYWGHHEAAGDLVAIVTALHSHMVVEHLLQHSSGNLFTINELSRVGELSHNRQIRRAFNYERMSTVGTEEHELSQPLTGAIFDTMVEVFQTELVKAGLIDQQLADDSYHGPDDPIDDAEIQETFDEAYEGQEDGFKIALLKARDYVGGLLAATWDRVSSDNFCYANVGLKLLEVDREQTGGEYQDIIRDCFAWREISVPKDSPLLRFRCSVDRQLIDTTTAPPEAQAGRVASVARRTIESSEKGGAKKGKRVSAKTGARHGSS